MEAHSEIDFLVGLMRNLKYNRTSQQIQCHGSYLCYMILTYKYTNMNIFYYNIKQCRKCRLQVVKNTSGDYKSYYLRLKRHVSQILLEMDYRFQNSSNSVSFTKSWLTNKLWHSSNNHELIRHVVNLINSKLFQPRVQCTIKSIQKLDQLQNNF